MAGQDAQDGLHAGVGGIGAIHIRTAAIAVLGIVIVGALDRVGILDLVAERRSGAAIGIGEEGRIAGDNRLKVGAGAAHDGLMVIVADRVTVSQRLEHRRIAGMGNAIGIGIGVHIVEPHGDGAFLGIEAAGRRRRAV